MEYSHHIRKETSTNIIQINEYDEENKENIKKNNLTKISNTKEINKKLNTEKNREKNKKLKEKKPKKRLCLYNKPNSSRNQLSLNLNLSISIDPTKNMNKNKSNKTSKTICIFHIEKVPKIKSSNNKNNINNNIQKYTYLNFNFEDKTEEVSYAGEYLEEIYFNLLIEESQGNIKPKMGYMNMQKEINEQMRAILIDWIIEVHFQFNLRQKTLYMTIWILDTYLSFHIISRKKLQLLGISCLLISCKSEEIYFPQQNKFIEVTDGAYTREEMLFMENEILKQLNFNIVFPTSNDFYDILSKLYNFNKKQYFLGKYLIESTLIDYQMIKYSASIVSAACVYLVMKYFGMKGYQKLYGKYIINENNPENIIKDTAKEIYVLVENLSKSKLNTVKNKYGLNQFENASEIL